MPPSDYEKAHATYRALAKAAQGGDKQAFADKAKAMNDIRAIERDAARAGTVLSATYNGDRIVTQSRSTESKRSLQEEYTRKFDGEVTVMLPDKPGGEPKEQTLRDFHRKRLLGGK
jgi:CTP-dependent riboflavin kinase